MADLNFNFDTICRNEFTKSTKHTFVWVISQFSSRPAAKQGEYLDSPQFTIKRQGDKDSKWHARLYPKGRGRPLPTEDTIRDIFSVVVCNDSDYDTFTMCELSTVDSKQNKKRLTEFATRKIESKSSFGWCIILKKTDDAFTLTDVHDNLTLVFDITLRGEVKETFELMENSNDIKCLSKNYHQDQLSQDLELLYYTGEYSDVRISCCGKQFHCHKNILASRSPVFKAMFGTNMKEKISGVVEIQDMSLDVFESLLKYIYKSEAPSFDAYDTLALGLFVASDKYELVKLKEFCETKLSSNVDFENCIDLLVIGDLHHAPILKSAALKFVSENMEKINPEEWRKNLIAHPTLFAEVEMKVEFWSRAEWLTESIEH